jgi:hypothetical protein
MIAHLLSMVAFGLCVGTVTFILLLCVEEDL